MMGLTSYIVIMNFSAFVMMGLDKRAAKRDEWRIPENALLLSAMLGGSLGAYAGMMHFHHKTRHWYFRIGLPSIILIHTCLLGIWLISKML